MVKNRYSAAGWLAISQAILFPLVFVAGIIQCLLGVSSDFFIENCCGELEFFFGDTSLGISDFLFALLTAFGVYVFIMFRKYLNERYEFKDINFLITLYIIWSITYFTGLTILNWLIPNYLPMTDVVFTAVYLTFFSFSMVSVGIIDIFIAVHLLKKKGFGNVMLNVFAYVILIAGVSEVTVFLSPIDIILFPVSCIVLGITLLRANEEIEFV